MGRATARKIVALYAEWPVVQADVPLILAASELEEHHTLSLSRRPGAPARAGW
jgi:hypothetical protein